MNAFDSPLSCFAILDGNAGICMFISFGILIPLAIFFAAYMKQPLANHGAWFQVMYYKECIVCINFMYVACTYVCTCLSVLCECCVGMCVLCMYVEGRGGGGQSLPLLDRQQCLFGLGACLPLLALNPLLTVPRCIEL